MVLRPSWAWRPSCGRCICLVSCSNSFTKRWLVRRSASISFVLECRASCVPPGGWLSTLPCWSCILGGLALLLLVFRVDTISHWAISFICKGNCRSHRWRQTDGAFFDRNWAGTCWNCWAGLLFLDVGLSCKNKKKGGSTGLRLSVLRCLSQFFSAGRISTA